MSTDPRKLGGDISGPGGPFDRYGVVVDLTNSVLMDSLTVSVVVPERDGEQGEVAIALLLGGRINKQPDRANVLFLMNEDGAASLVAEVMGAAARSADFAPGFIQRVEERVRDMPTKEKPGG